MSKIEYLTKNCNSCSHFGYCVVDWGADCKRQGGKKIPRMKPRMVQARKSTKQPETEKPRNRTVAVFESIRTKVAYW